MKKSIKLFFILFISIFIPITQSNGQSVTDNKVNDTIKPLMKKYHINGIAVAVIDHSKKSIYVFGKTNRGDEITVNTLFQLGSITKVMTTLLLSEDILTRQIKITDPMTNYLTQFSKNAFLKKITLEQLATFSSGLPFNQPDEIATKSQLQQYLLYWEPKSTTENQWRYSNISIGILGDILSKEKHQNINKLFENNIFSPLNMRSSNLKARPETQPWSEIFFPSTWALQSNIIDMSHFLAAAIGLKNTQKNILLAMHFSQTPHIQVGNMGQALAWQIFSLNNRKNLLDSNQYMNLLKSFPIKKLPLDKQRYSSNALIDKTGMTHRFESYIAVIPNQESGIVILVNNTHVSLNSVVKAGRKILLCCEKNKMHTYEQ